MVVANFADKGIQQSHSTTKELNFHLSMSIDWKNCLYKGNWTHNKKLRLIPNSENEIYIWKNVIPIVVFEIFILWKWGFCL